LQTRRSLKLPDTDPEECFDRMTRRAKRLFNTRIELVSLVESERQWFRSRQGLDASETCRDTVFRGLARLDDEMLLVDDTHIDERFSDNPLVTGDACIRFYAGCPVSAPARCTLLRL
jgi:GAF domain-containing protein